MSHITNSCCTLDKFALASVLKCVQCIAFHLITLIYCCLHLSRNYVHDLVAPLHMPQLFTHCLPNIICVMCMIVICMIWHSCFCGICCSIECCIYVISLHYNFPIYFFDFFLKHISEIVSEKKNLVIHLACYYQMPPIGQ